MLRLFSSQLSSEEIPKILWEEIPKCQCRAEAQCRVCLSSKRKLTLRINLLGPYKRELSPDRIALLSL